MNQAEWKCPLCGEREDGMKNPLPPRQFAHTLANRFSGRKPRNGGVKNALTAAERLEFMRLLGGYLGASWKDIASHGVDLCAECHEEVLGEPVFLPTTHARLSELFRGRTRVEKMVLLAVVLASGAKQVGDASKSGNLMDLIREFGQ